MVKFWLETRNIKLIIIRVYSFIKYSFGANSKNDLQKAQMEWCFQKYRLINQLERNQGVSMCQ